MKIFERLPGSMRKESGSQKNAPGNHMNNKFEYRQTGKSKLTKIELGTNDPIGFVGHRIAEQIPCRKLSSNLESTEQIGPSNTEQPNCFIVSRSTMERVVWTIEHVPWTLKHFGVVL